MICSELQSICSNLLGFKRGVVKGCIASSQSYSKGSFCSFVWPPLCHLPSGGLDVVTRTTPVSTRHPHCLKIAAVFGKLQRGMQCRRIYGNSFDQQARHLGRSHGIADVRCVECKVKVASRCDGRKDDRDVAVTSSASKCRFWRLGCLYIEELMISRSASPRITPHTAFSICSLIICSLCDI